MRLSTPTARLVVLPIILGLLFILVILAGSSAGLLLTQAPGPHAVFSRSVLGSSRLTRLIGGFCLQVDFACRHARGADDQRLCSAARSFCTAIRPSPRPVPTASPRPCRPGERPRPCPLAPCVIRDGSSRCPSCETCVPIPNPRPTSSPAGECGFDWCPRGSPGLCASPIVPVSCDDPRCNDGPCQKPTAAGPPAESVF